MTNKNNLYIFFLFVVFVLLDPTNAQATTTVAEDTLCNLLNIAQGSVGKSIAAFAIIFIGVSLFMGKVSWGLAISTAIGIGAIFGAASIVDALGAGSTSCTNNIG